MPESVAPPRALGTRGRKTWRALHEVYEFDTHETALVVEVCRMLDTIEALQGAIDAGGIMVSGSQGQPVVNGAVAELRQQQLALARLLTILNLGAADSSAGLQSAVSAAAARAADARWSRARA